MPPDRFDSRVPSSAVPQTKREARQRQRQIARLAEQRAGFEGVDEQQDVKFEGGEFVPDEQAVDEAEKNVAAETATDSEFVQIGDIDVGINQDTLDVETLGLTEEGRQRAQRRQAEELRSKAADQVDGFDRSDFTIDRGGEEVTVEPTEEAVDRERREQAAQQFESQSQFIADVSPQDVNLSDGSAQLDEQVVEQAEQQATRQAAADALAERIEGFGFAEPSDVTRQNGEFVLSDSARSDLQSAVDSGVIDQSEISNIDESVDPSVLGSVEAQIKSQLDATPALNTEGVLQRAAGQDEIYRAVEEQIEEQTGTDVRPGLIEDANLDVDADGTISADRVLLNSRRFDGFRDVDDLPDDVLGDANLSVDATEQFNEQIRESIAEQISERNVVDVSPDEIDISGGNVSAQTPESLTIEAEEIGSDGLTSEGQSDFARRQLQSIQTTDGVSVDTPVNSQPFANVSGRLAQAARGKGSLSSATRIVAASDTVSNIGDLDDLPDARIIEGLEPDQAEQRLGIDADTVREAQQDIEQRRQQLNNDPGSVLQDIADNQDEFINDSTRIGVAGERGRRIRQSARSQLNELEADIAAGDDDVSAGDVGLTLTDDLSGIRSIDEGGRQAIAQSVDDQLANFGAEEIEVGVSGGEITTSIEDSVRERFVENAQRVDEIQARNEIADSTEGIDRRDIEVDAGEGVSPTDQLVTETLGSDVDADIESFDELQQAAQTQARFNARQQAIDQVESQTIGSVDPRNVSVERTEQGFEANVSGAAAQTTNLSAVNASSAVDEAIDLGSGQQNDDEPLVQAGEDLPDSIGEVPSAVAGGGEFVDVNAPTRPPEIRRAVSDTAQDAIGVDIDRDIGRQTLQDVRSTGRDIVTGDFDVPDGSPVAGAAGIAVAAPEPVSTGTGAAILGGLALGGAITSVANNQAEIDVPDRTPASGFSEIDIGQTRQEIDEINVPEQTPASNVGEIDIPDRATTDGEIDVPEQTPASGTGEVDIPSIDAAQLIGRGDLVEEGEDETVLGGEDIPINPFENPREQGSTPERFIREDRDAFVIRNPENPEINQEQAQEPAVDEVIDTGVGSGFGTGTDVGAGTEPIAPVGSGVDTQPGVGSGTEPIAPVGSGVDTLSGVDDGVVPETGSGVDTDTGVRSDTQADADTQFDTPTRQQTMTQNTFVEPNFTETTPGFESGFQRQPNRTGRSRRRPRRPNVAVDSDANSGEEGGKQRLDSEIAEFDFLSLGETDDRIEDVLGGG